MPAALTPGTIKAGDATREFRVAVRGARNVAEVRTALERLEALAPQLSRRLSERDRLYIVARWARHLDAELYGRIAAKHLLGALSGNRFLERAWSERMLEEVTRELDGVIEHLTGESERWKVERARWWGPLYGLAWRGVLHPRSRGWKRLWAMWPRARTAKVKSTLVSLLCLSPELSSEMLEKIYFMANVQDRIFPLRHPSVPVHLFRHYAASRGWRREEVVELSRIARACEDPETWREMLAVAEQDSSGRLLKELGWYTKGERLAEVLFRLGERDGPGTAQRLSQMTLRRRREIGREGLGQLLASEQSELRLAAIRIAGEIVRPEPKRRARRSA